MSELIPSPASPVGPVFVGLRAFHFLLRLVLAVLFLAAGILAGLAFLEILLNLNPHLLLRGMGVPAAVDDPLRTIIYDVYVSDADIFLWEYDRLQPVSPEQDRLEAHVVYHTDEWGFPNLAPLPPAVDVVILGRSYSLGAQAENPWPRLLEDLSGWQVLNLSQTGGGTARKHGYLRRFGLPRRPRWVVMEVLPPSDILGWAPISPALVQDLPFPIAQSLLRRWYASRLDAPPTNIIYPLSLDFPGGAQSLVFYNGYLDTYGVDDASLRASSQLAGFERETLALVQDVSASGACLALLYVPTRESIYLPLLQDPAQLQPALQGLEFWRLGAGGSLQRAPGWTPAPEEVIRNALAGLRVLADFAHQHGIPLIDPSAEMTRSALAGVSPYMIYDSHWSAVGHQIVARQVLESLQTIPCP